MLKILDLFSGTQSVRKALDNMGIEYEYYGIDIYSPEEENIILDLSQEDIAEKVINVLPKDWKPDFIWASPVCNKFSIATAVKGGTVYFEKTNNGIKPRENLEPLKNTQFKDYTLETITKETTLHLKLVYNMQLILNYYDTNFVIENPRTSYMVYYLDVLYVPNKVDYCMYGFDYKKPTTIYSNYNLGLKTCNHYIHGTKIGSHKKTFQANVGKYSDRASVPPKLIEDILNLFNEKSI